MQPAARFALFGAALMLVAGGVYFVSQSRGRAQPPPAAQRAPSSSAPVASTRAPATDPGTLVDPISPDRPMSTDRSARVAAESWVNARPGFQYSHSAAQRGGVEPCYVQNVDTSAFEAWVPLARGHFVAPRTLAIDESGHFNLVIHLNGDEPIRRELVESKQTFVLYTLTLDPSQGYAPLFTGSGLYAAIVAGAEQSLSKRAGKTVHVGHVAMSAWSAGFVGIEAALGQPASKDIDAVILIDGLHAPRSDRNAFKAQMKPFVDFAARAAAGERFMLVSHSSIDPPDFASTTECAHYLISALGGKPEPVRRADPLGLELVEYFNRGNFFVRGYAGNDKADHCAQLAVLREAYAALGRRWQQ